MDSCFSYHCSLSVSYEFGTVLAYKIVNRKFLNRKYDKVFPTSTRHDTRGETLLGDVYRGHGAGHCLHDAHCRSVVREGGRHCAGGAPQHDVLPGLPATEEQPE